METTVRLNAVRLAPRKVRAAVGLIRGKNLPVALTQLEHLVRRPAGSLLKLLRSASVNAEQNFQMVPDNLYIKRAFVDEGVKLKRFMPRAQGRATPIHKTLSRVTIVLDERVAGMRGQTPRRQAKAGFGQASASQAAPASAGEKQPHAGEHAKPEVKREIGTKPAKIGIGGLAKKFFQRKSI